MASIDINTWHLIAYEYCIYPSRIFYSLNYFPLIAITKKARNPYKPYKAKRAPLPIGVFKKSSMHKISHRVVNCNRQLGLRWSSIDDIRGITIYMRVQYRIRSLDIDRDTHHPRSRTIIRTDPASIARHTRAVFLWIWSVG